MNSAWHIRY